MIILPGWSTRVPAWLISLISRSESSALSQAPAIRTNAGSSFGSFPTSPLTIRQEDPKATAAFYTSGF